MAEKRMFTQKIIDSDPFTEMPLSAQALYFHLNIFADDDGFVNNPKKITRSIGAAEDDLRLLITKRFVLAFDNGVIAIKHWRMHNTLKKDRYKPTQYQEQYAMLEVKGNNAYTEKDFDSTPVPEWNQNGIEPEPQYSIDKYSKDKCSIDKINKGETERNAYGLYSNVLLTLEEYETLQAEFPNDYVKRINALSSYMKSSGKKYDDHLATIRNWAIKEQAKPTQPGQACSNPFLLLAMQEEE